MKIQQRNLGNEEYIGYDQFMVSPIRSYVHAASEFNIRNPNEHPMSYETARLAELRALRKLRKALEELDAIDAEREEADAR